MLLLYRKVTRLWWTYDDAFHFHQVLTHSFREILFSRQFWEQLPNRVFTPLLFVSIKFETALFGTDATAFYIRHLVAVTIAILLLYFTCRLWLSPAWSFASAMIAAVGPPMCEITSELYHRHYVDGLILSFGAVILQIIAIRRERTRLSFIAAVLYFAAMAEKEVYVPLLLIIAAVPERNFRDRMLHLWPWSISFAVYAFWRIAMLGPYLTGYGWVTAQEDRWRMFATLPLRIVIRIGGSDRIAAMVFLMSIAVALAIVFVRFPRGRLLFVVGAAAAVLPILPVSYRIETRFVLTAWILISIALAFLGRTKPVLGVVLLVSVFIAALVANRREWSGTYRLTRRMSIEARALAVSNERDVLLNPAIPPASVGELRWLTHARGSVLYDELPVCEGRLKSGTRLLAYDAGAVRALDIAQMQKESCSKIVPGAPLFADFHYSDGTLWWKLGPDDSGRYSLVIGEGAQAFEMPSHGGFRIAGPVALPIRVRYEKDGHVTYSPQLSVPLSEGHQLTWHR